MSESDWRNVFQLWEEQGKVLPMKVQRWTWHPSTFFEITEITIKKFPYGDAWGYMYLRGAKKDQNKEKLGCAGCYQWKVIK